MRKTHRDGISRSKVMQTVLGILMILSLLTGNLLQGISPAPLQAQVSKENQTPSTSNPLNSGSDPTIQVTPDHGYAGQNLQVSGTGDLTFSRVRLAWWYGEATETVSIISLTNKGTYNTNLAVPADAPPGTAQLCVAHDGTQHTPFICTNFTIDTPPPGRVQGQINLSDPSQPVNASLTLYDLEGTPVVTTSVQNDGSFLTPDLPPGTYEATFGGSMAGIVESQDVQVQPGFNTVIEPGTIVVPCSISHVGAVNSIMANPGLKKPGLYSPSLGKIIGTYLSLGASGPPVIVGFTPIIQTTPGVVIERVEFYVQPPGGSETLFATDTTGPIWGAAYNVSLLPPGYNTIIVKAFAAQGCIRENRVRLSVLPNPMNDPLLRNAQVSFDYVTDRYNFSATFINAPGVLPLVYPDPPLSLPVIGTIENRLDTGVHFAGYLEMDRDVTLTFASSDALVRLLGIDLYNDSEPWINNSVSLGKSDYASFKTPGMVLASFDEKIPVYSGPVVSFLGIVTLNASLSIGFKGLVTFHATLEPMEPDLDLSLQPSAGPYLPISLWLTFIGFGIASVTGTTEVTVTLPLGIKSNESPPVSLDDPCLRLRFWLEVWIGIDYYIGSVTFYDDIYDIFEENWGECASLAMTMSGPQVRNKPRIMAEPAVVSGPNGAMFTVLVEDNTPTADTITPVIVGHFWDGGAWSDPVALSDAQHYVSDPEATFIGPNGEIIVVWAQNMLSRAEMATLGSDLNAIYSQQEIFYNFFDGTNWSGPIQLTMNSVPDGFPDIAGDEHGGATLAWSVDTDGDLATRTDLEINSAEWGGLAAKPLVNAGGREHWQEPQTLSPIRPQHGPDTAMDVQPLVIRPGEIELLAAIAWARDLDGEPSTNTDRVLVIARLTENGWSFEVPSEIPVGVDSPALGWDSDQNILYTAFLVRDRDSDGTTETGMGDQAVLWTGQWTDGSGWENVTEILDESGEPVRAENPHIQVRPDEEALLLFRRFGSAESPGQLGNLALSRRTPFSQFSPPLYVINDAEQNWMQSMAVDSFGQAMIVSVQRVFPNIPAQSNVSVRQAAPGARVATLSSTADPVNSLLLSPDADPTIDPDLRLSSEHAPAGATVGLTVTVRNVGRAEATDIHVNLYSGTPGGGVLLDTIVIGTPLAFNETQMVNFDVIAAGGPQPIYAEVTTIGSDADPDNNVVTADLGTIPSPTLVGVHDSGNSAAALQIVWTPATVNGVEGYRILRSESPGGPYILVGQSVGDAYVDHLLEPGKTYSYVVQAYDVYGVFSPYSNEGSAALALKVFLPILQHN